jgi:hypothetical protein
MREGGVVLAIGDQPERMTEMKFEILGALRERAYGEGAASAVSLTG